MALMDNYSNEEFENIVRTSYSYKECLLNLGYNSNSGDATMRLKKKIQDLQIDTSHFQQQKKIIPRTVENIFVENSTAAQKTLREWYKKGNYTEYKCQICGLEPFWRGKELTLILDHINGVNNDDRLENLRWVCPNCNQQLDTTNGKNKKHKEHEINLCIDCGQPISKKSIRCKSCDTKARQTNEVQGISREELKNLIRTMPFTKIGEKYQVSDNAIRKWCDKYGLPRKATEIKKISDEDWEKI